MSKADYEDPETNVIHLFSYSIGKQRVITWAAYLRNENKVYFDGACKFNTYAFIQYQKEWQKRGFAPLSVQIESKFTPRINAYLGSSRHPLIRTREDAVGVSLHPQR